MLNIERNIRNMNFIKSAADEEGSDLMHYSKNIKSGAHVFSIERNADAENFIDVNYKAGYLREIEEFYSTNSFYQSLKLIKRFSDVFQRHGTGIVAENPEGEIILVKNYRYINDYDSWEIPAGTIPPGSDPADCVLEELKEEAGCTADKSELVHIGNYFPSIGSSSQIFHCYYARNVKQITTELDGNEILEAKWFTKDETKNMMSDGTIKDGFTLVLLMRFLFLLK